MFSQISKAIGWYHAIPSVDYFNVCSTDTDGLGRIYAGVPSNAFGYRTAASGNAYAGEISHTPNENREIMGAQLITPLQIGTRYYVSFKVSLAGQAGGPQFCGINKLGILFSTVSYNSNIPPPICNCSQIYTDSIITDTLNWTRITGSFIADSNYSFISIGRFYVNSLTDTTQISGTMCISYYYFDDICVSTDSAFAYNYTYVGVPEINSPPISPLQIFPNPFHSSFTINCPLVTEALEVTIFNSLGQTVYRQIINQQSEIINPNLAAGVYFLRLGEAVQKLIVY